MGAGLRGVAGGVVAYRGLRSHRFIGLGWIMHAGWDLVHHAYANAIWPFMPTSSFQCLIFDSLIAIWFFAGAPSVLAWFARDRGQGRYAA